MGDSHRQHFIHSSAYDRHSNVRCFLLTAHTRKQEDFLSKLPSLYKREKNQTDSEKHSGVRYHSAFRKSIPPDTLFSPGPLAVKTGLPRHCIVSGGHASFFRTETTLILPEGTSPSGIGCIRCSREKKLQQTANSEQTQKNSKKSRIRRAIRGYRHFPHSKNLPRRQKITSSTGNFFDAKCL